MMRTNHRYTVLLLLLGAAMTVAAQTRLYGDWGSSYKKQKSKTNHNR